MLTPYGKREWLTIIAITLLIVALDVFYLKWYWLAGAVAVFALLLLSFFRDPNRHVPAQKGIMVSPADGRISSIHEVENYEPLGGPATCIRIFLSVADVHVNRAPCHGYVSAIVPKPGLYLNALNPKSAEVNESNLIVLVHPIKRTPIAAIRQVSGLIARRIVCGVQVGQTLQRGQRIGMIKFGSTTELYVPQSAKPEVEVRQGQYVWGGKTVLLRVSPAAADIMDGIEATPPGSASAQAST
jgi:phosphatidylserine decarboxylase